MTRSRERFVRVHSGSLRGRRLRYPDDAALRPTMQRAKASLFDALGEAVRGAVFADLYAAAGGMGIEALSRGAAFVHFVERDSRALSLLRTNLEACRVAPERFLVHAAAVADGLAGGALRTPGVEVAFADPPYGGDGAQTVLAHFDAAAYPRLRALVIEHGGTLSASGLRALRLVRERRFGGTHVSFFAAPGGDA
ncbi:MAG: RsmD family RNA methyltransferase [Candidatus Krumholzibacteria bacterium]|nr:RsmD family RNA methyltransferase [Candidatus Krumholzibacteria bacterium]